MYYLDTENKRNVHMLTDSLDRENLDLSLCNPWSHETS